MVIIINKKLEDTKKRTSSRWEEKWLQYFNFEGKHAMEQNT